MQAQVVIAVLMALFYCNPAYSADEIGGKVVDGRGRPLQGVDLVIYTNSSDYFDKKGGKRLRSKADGSYIISVEGPIDEDHELFVEVQTSDGKPDFAIGARKKEDLSEIVLKKKITKKDYRDLGTLSGDALREEVIKILSSDSADDYFFQGKLIEFYDQIEPILISLVEDPYLGSAASSYLLEFGDSKATDFLFSKLDNLQDERKILFRSWLADGLLYPETETQWKIHEALVAEGRGNPFVFAINPDPRGKVLLEKMLAKCGDEPCGNVERMLQYKIEHPEGIVFSADLDESVRNFLKVRIEEDSLKDAKYTIQYNKTHTLARVDVSVLHRYSETHTDGYGFSISFRKTDGHWIPKSSLERWIT